RIAPEVEVWRPVAAHLVQARDLTSVLRDVRDRELVVRVRVVWRRLLEDGFGSACYARWITCADGEDEHCCGAEEAPSPREKHDGSIGGPHRSSRGSHTKRREDCPHGAHGAGLQCSGGRRSEERRVGTEGRGG